MKSKTNPLRRQPQQKRSQERVERILDAAAIVFDEVGFEAATTHDIAARANTAVGSLYQFFPDKLAIFNALELRHVDRVYLMWEKLERPEIIQLPFVDFIHTLVSLVEQLFTNPISRIVFVRFFISPKIFKNIDASFTQEAIQFTAQLFRMRNPALTEQRSQLLAEVAVNSSNTLILIALRTNKAHSQEIITEIENLLKAYLEADIGDATIKRNSFNSLEKVAKQYKLNSRQSLILEYAGHSSKITIQNCEAMFPDISRRTLQRDLKVMLDQKLLIPEGNTDLRCYVLNSEKPNLRQLTT
jgi:AcrR family transcriptional regulator